MKQKSIYFFADGKAEGTAKMKDLLGGKGANLAEMSNLGIPVPAGFTITTEVCNFFYSNKKKLPLGFEKDLSDNIKRLENSSGKAFGNVKSPPPFQSGLFFN